MKLRFFSGIFLAVLGGVLFAKTFLIFIDVTGNFSRETYNAVANLFPKIKNLNNLAFVSQNNIDNQDEERGGKSGEENFLKSEILLEDFPANDDFVLSKQKISEDLSIPQEGKVIVANLESMKLDLYKDGELIKNYTILSKGRPSTPWETPPGSFEILYKKENHFSTIGKVWMPYSIQFFGNYFIHGWPYHPDGSPVADGFSGGCIRLANDDISEVYKFGDISTKVVILGATENSISFSEKGKYEFKNDSETKIPRLTAKSFLVADLETGQIITSKNEKELYPIASLTKLMTALVSLETINQYKETTVSQTAYATYGAQGNLKPGQVFQISDLMYPLLLESSNDAAEVLAEFSGRTNFMKNMNDKAKSIGLFQTDFDDPSGLSEKNISTAEDLFKLVKYIFNYKSYIFDVSKMKKHETETHTWLGNHKFRNEEYYIGGKNGYTDEARYTLVTLVELPLGQKEKRKIAIILLQADKTENDTRNIISYLLKNVYYID
jgi:lipoprotein-anchoring transpeptidase ErfK/SrfK